MPDFTLNYFLKPEKIKFEDETKLILQMAEIFTILGE